MAPQQKKGVDMPLPTAVKSKTPDQHQIRDGGLEILSFDGYTAKLNGEGFLPHRHSTQCVQVNSSAVLANEDNQGD